MLTPITVLSMTQNILDAINMYLDRLVWTLKILFVAQGQGSVAQYRKDIEEDKCTAKEAYFREPQQSYQAESQMNKVEYTKIEKKKEERESTSEKRHIMPDPEDIDKDSEQNFPIEAQNLEVINDPKSNVN